MILSKDKYNKRAVIKDGSKIGKIRKRNRPF